MYAITASGGVTNGNGMFLPPTNNGTDAWGAYQAWLDAGNTPLPYIPPIPVDPSTTIEAKELLKGYFMATKQLRQLAGQTVPDNEWVKLEDSQYETTLTQAIINNSSSPANLAVVNATTTKILYTFTQLTLKLQIAWESFTYDGSY